MRRRFGTGLGAGLLAAVVMTSAASAQSLFAAYDLARDNDPRFRAAQAEFKASQTLPDQARAGFLPTARLEFEQMKSRQRIISSRNPIFTGRWACSGPMSTWQQ